MRRPQGAALHLGAARRTWGAMLHLGAPQQQGAQCGATLGDTLPCTDVGAQHDPQGAQCASVGSLIGLGNRVDLDAEPHFFFAPAARLALPLFHS